MCTIYGGIESIFSNKLPNMVMHTGLSQGILFLCPKGLGNYFCQLEVKIEKNKMLFNFIL